MAIAPLLLPPEEGPGGEFLFCSATGPRYPKLHKSSFLFLLRVPRGRGWQCARPRLHIPIPLSLRQWAAGSGPRTRCLLPRPLPSRGARWVLQPHTQTPLRDALPFESGPWAPLRCPTAGTSMSPLVPLVRPLGAWLELPRAVSLAPEDHQTRLRDSVRPASLPSSGAIGSPQCWARMPLSCVQKSRSYWRRTRYSRPLQPRWSQGSTKAPLLHRSQETRWVTSNLGPACSEPGPCQAPVQDVDAETPLSMRPSLRLGCSDRPERRLLPCLDPPSIPLCVQRGEHTSRPSPSGTSAGWGFRSTGKRANSPLCRGSLFSARSWTSVNLTARLSEERAQSMLRCLESLQRKRAVPLKHFQRLLGHMASSAAITPLGLLHMRPLQRWLHDRVPRWAWHHGTYRVSLNPVLPSHLQPMVGSCFSSGRSSPRASIQARCCFNRRLCHGLGGHVQRARSRGALDRAPAAVAYQLPRVAGSMACSAPLQNAATREAYTGPARTTLRPLCTSTTKAVYAPVACRNSPAISSFGVRSIWGRFAPFMSQASSIVQPTSSHVSTPFRENGDSTPRYSSWFGDASGTLR